ncbi:MAG: hypothetical protein LBC72_05900 [Spirochaetaceae bacterium]|jgi:hypothetical protein|nr:hypothetical protein [Spirochaetaceae bacterium]
MSSRVCFLGLFGRRRFFRVAARRGLVFRVAAGVFLCGVSVYAPANDAEPPPFPPPPAEQAVSSPENGPPPPDVPAEGLHPALRDQALVLNVSTRVLDGSGGEMWTSGNSKITLPGRPVGVKVTGENIVCAVQFTPYINRKGEALLVAQGQVWLQLPDGVLRYETIIKTIPVEFGEQVYFFPLGSANTDETRLEICLDMRPYSNHYNFEKRGRPRRGRDGPPAGDMGRPPPW